MVFDCNMALIVLNYNTYAETKKNVLAVLACQEQFPIIIVDNHSTDNSYKNLCEFFQTYENIIVIQSEKNGGYSYGNNYGISYAKSLFPNIEFFGIMNPDVFFDSPFIFSEMIKKLNADEDLALITPMMVQDDHLRLDKVAWRVLDKKRVWKKHSYWRRVFFKSYKGYTSCPVKNNVALCEVVPGSFFLIKKRVYDAIDGFDEGLFLYCEESTLGYKVKKLGMYEGVLITSTYQHEHSLTRPSLKKQQVTLQRELVSIRYFAKKYLGFGRFRLTVLKFMGFISIRISMPLCEFIKKVIKKGVNQYEK